MNCKNFQQVLYEYLDGTLPFQVEASIKEHLESCNTCSQALAREQNFASSMSKLLDHNTSSLVLRPDIRGNVLSPRTPALRPAWVLATAACLIVTAIVIFQNYWPRRPPAKHRQVYSMSMATIYTDKTKTDWVERRMLVKARRTEKEYAQLIAHKLPEVNKTD